MPDEAEVHDVALVLGWQMEQSQANAGREGHRTGKGPGQACGRETIPTGPLQDAVRTRRPGSQPEPSLMRAPSGFVDGSSIRAFGPAVRDLLEKRRPLLHNPRRRRHDAAITGCNAS